MSKITWKEINLDGNVGTAYAELPNGRVEASCKNNLISGFVCRGGKSAAYHAALNLPREAERLGKESLSQVDILSIAQEEALKLLKKEIFA